MKTRSLETSGGEQKMTCGGQHQKIDCQRKIYEELKDLEEQRAKERSFGTRAKEAQVD